MGACSPTILPPIWIGRLCHQDHLHLIMVIMGIMIIMGIGHHCHHYPHCDQPADQRFATIGPVAAAPFVGYGEVKYMI